MYMDMLDPLAEGANLAAPDLPGHGSSTWQGTISDWSSLADYYLSDLPAFIRSGDTVGIGHSIGGIVTAIMSNQRPGLFSRLILLDPVLLDRSLIAIIATMRLLGQDHNFPLAKKAYRRKRQFSSREKALDHYRKKRVFSGFGENTLERYVDHCMQAMEDGSLSLSCSPELEASIYRSLPLSNWQQIRKLSVPTLILVGEDSDTISSRGVKRLSRINSNLIVQTLPGGHLFPLENPETSADLIRSFLKA